MIRETKMGPVQGFIDTRSNSLAWMGIPYAQPPIGDLRWKAPRPIKPWQKVRPALKPGNPCVQPSHQAGIAYEGSEDCLYLNIWTPKFSRDEEQSGNQRLPVMFWIHGGANAYGSGASYGGGELAVTQKVIVVTINYRLGYFGWFSHPALVSTSETVEDGSGNYGTLDMIQALQWVKDNISAFGGDPANITIFGQSSGGLNVLSLVVSPRAKGLFGRAIKQSGPVWESTLNAAQNYADDPEAPGHSHSSGELLLHLLQNDGLAKDRKAAKEQVLKMADSEIMDYLRSKTFSQLDAAYLAAGKTHGVQLSPAYVTPKVFLDGNILPGISFLQAIRQGNYNQVPLMFGSTKDEVKLFLRWNPELVTKKGEEIIINDIRYYNLVGEYSSKLYKAVYSDLYSGTAANSQKIPVFSYRFDWDEQPTVNGVDYSVLLGAAHGCELPFIFGVENTAYPPEQVDSHSFSPLSNAMMSYWAQFASTGNPGKGRRGELPEWSAWDSTSSEANKTMILDSGSGGGFRMSADALNRESVLADVEADSRLSTSDERCSLYQDIYNSLPNTYRHFLSEEEFKAKAGETCYNKMMKTL